MTMGPGTNPEVVVRLREVKVPKEDARHLVVIVLSRVDEDLTMPVTQCACDGCRLDELGTRADDRNDLHEITSLDALVTARRRHEVREFVGVERVAAWRPACRGTSAWDASGQLITNSRRKT